ncbi:MAG: TIGR02680 family protein [Pseudonocardiaceae bacterium]|nr:TIGR02680 family protein [Pseudonocardiaceae bacterium]
MRPARWIPSRAGILNVWRYYDEIFEFHNGRLLLRGPNGTGKSKALELLLPYLFDASLRPHRLSTFGTGERTMWWNLMGEGATGSTRVGYVWLEFRHEASDEWFCCGARLQASQHTRTPSADYFTTTQRIGFPGGLRLVGETGAPLTRAALDEAIGEHGTLHANATEYRTTMRHTLFPELSEQRYDALITALLQLRQPKLSERLDPGLLSSLLSRALPPLGQAEITELAEGFERLDRQREQLRELEDEAEAAKTVAARQASYAQRVLRASAATLVSATTELDNLTRTARSSEGEYQQVVEQNAETEQRKQHLDRRTEQLSSRIEGLRDSEEYKRGKELDKLRQQAGEAERTARDERARATARQHTARQDRERAEVAERTARSAADAELAARDDVTHAADRADLRSVPEEIATTLETDRNPRTLLSAAVRSRQDQIAGVRHAVDDYDATLRRRSDAESELERARDALSEAAAKRAECAEAYSETVGQQVERLRQWAASNVELVFDDIDELAANAESESAVLRFVEPVSRAVAQAITAEETTVSGQRQEVRRERGELAAEIERLRHEVDLPPDSPLTRTADRSTMDGAPLWKLVAFQDHVSPASQAAVEAALQASGLLDAWVPPSGAIEIAEHDTFLNVDRFAVLGGRSLADVLRPEPGAPISEERIRRLLAGIAYDESLPEDHVTAISADGRWRLAGATGSWAKPESAHIGTAARERARQRRIEQLDATLSALDERLRRLAERRRQLDTELAGRPGHDSVEEARTAWERAASHETAADGVVRRWVETVEAREKEVGRTLKALTALAAQNGLPAERAALDALDHAVVAFRDLADNWLDRHSELIKARHTALSLAERAESSEEIATERAADADAAETKARELTSTLEAVQSTIGADYREVLAEINELREQHREAKEAAGREDTALRELARRIGSLDSQRTIDAEKRDEAITARDTAAARFRRLATGNLPRDAGIELETTTSDGVKATLEAARTVAARWPNIPHTARNLNDALARLSEAVHNCRETLSRRADLILEPDEDIQVFTASMDGVRIGAAELVTTLRTEAERSRGDITERERELFDRTLTGDTRRHLADRIRQAGDLVETMNARLERVRTASNVAVRLVWQVNPELPAGTKAARELLLKDPVRLTDDDRASLHQFFRDRIEQARVDNAAASWEQQLAQVFDYTAWHQFVVKIDRANGTGWQLLTKKLHGALSGGEKAIALHLPLFAAVAAHYQSVPTAPRLILLDEVFVGVDTTNRGQVFELLSSLDLDLVLTSDHEWCMYAELDGIAVHQLITGGDDDAVTTARFTWDGADLVPEEEA